MKTYLTMLAASALLTSNVSAEELQKHDFADKINFKIEKQETPLTHWVDDKRSQHQFALTAELPRDSQDGKKGTLVFGESQFTAIDKEGKMHQAKRSMSASDDEISTNPWTGSFYLIFESEPAPGKITLSGDLDLYVIELEEIDIPLMPLEDVLDKPLCIGDFQMKASVDQCRFSDPPRTVLTLILNGDASSFVFKLFNEDGTVIPYSGRQLKSETPYAFKGMEIYLDDPALVSSAKLSGSVYMIKDRTKVNVPVDIEFDYEPCTVVEEDEE